jgi:hypothetical protein
LGTLRSVLSPGKAPMELDEALKEIDRLKGELKKFDGVDPQQVQNTTATNKPQKVALTISPDN